MKKEMEQLKTYESPKLKHHLIEVDLKLLANSAEKTVKDKDKGMQEQWEEETITETFIWEW